MLAPRLAAIGALLAVISLISIVPEASAARERACPRLPDVSWWDTTPEKIVSYVDRTFQGDWDPYIAKWESYRIKMANIYRNNGAAVVKSRGLRLEGDSLADHIRDIDQRLKVTVCLKERFGGKYV